jgi:hypothetical protein
MKVGMDALIAEIARCLDWNFLECDPKFDALSRPHRMQLILASLVREDVAKAEKSDGGVGVRWRASHRLESHFGVTRHGIPDEYEDAGAPEVISTLADEFSKDLQVNGDAVEVHTVYAASCFAMYRLGMLEYRGKEDGFCQFYKSPDFVARSEELERRGDLASVTEVVDEARNTVEFIEEYGPLKSALPSFQLRLPRS